MWRWQQALRQRVIDEGSLDAVDLTRRDGLPALLFRLENASGAGQRGEAADAILAWFARHPSFQAARSVLVELLSAAVAPLGPGVRVPEAMRVVQNMLQTRVEQWIEQWKQEGEERGEQKRRRQGVTDLLVRQLQRWFGVLPGWATDRVLAADTAMLEEWSLRVLDAASLEELLAGQ